MTARGRTTIKFNQNVIYEDQCNAAHKRIVYWKENNASDVDGSAPGNSLWLEWLRGAQSLGVYNIATILNGQLEKPTFFCMVKVP